MSKIEKFINEFEFNTNIILLGLPGRGKTYIMKKLFEKVTQREGYLNRSWLEDGEFREFITCGNMSLKPVDSNGVDITLYPLEMAVRAKILFFDDLGSSGNVSDSQKTKLKFILDQREKKNLITIFSTNLTPKELSELYGERIKSRIFNGKHKKGLQMITINGEDRRKENIKNINL